MVTCLRIGLTLDGRWTPPGPGEDGSFHDEVAFAGDVIAGSVINSRTSVSKRSVGSPWLSAWGSGRLTSAVGYQLTLAMEMGAFQERITSTRNGSITSHQAVYVPADDMTDPAPATNFRSPR